MPRVRRSRRSSIPSSRVVGRVPVAAAVAVALLAALSPSGDRGASAFGWCLVCGERGVADALVNLALFLPLGAALAAARVPFRWAVAGAVALSLAIELSQLAFPVGRYPGAGDVFWNAAGALAAYRLARSGGWRRALEHPLAPGAAALIAALVLAGTAWLLRPGTSRAPYFGSWTPRKGNFVPYQGRILRATLGPLSLPSERLSGAAQLPQLLAAGEKLDLTFIAGPAPARAAYLFGVTEENRYDVVRFQPEGPDLVVVIHTRAEAWRLAQPTLRYRGLLSGAAAGDTIRLAWRRGPGGWCADVGGGAQCVRWRVGRGWALLFGGTPAGPSLLAIGDAVWVVVLLVPAGLAVVAGRRRRIASGRAPPL